ncbi:hypothetical protein [Candidatus Laterigemmans baculatus]|uniref:hypothetical protein n=1 Tax=Candidatus Laterigemmans baculatus TaxID=2770505 RepID=UPI001F195CC8|nr:hypothetical protein [Candidatus Laterigemmans baculatus]
MIEPRHQQLGQFALAHKPDPAVVRAKQKQIFDATLALSRRMDGPNFTRIGPDDLQRMAIQYDQLFFDSQLVGGARREGIRFGWSSRMTRNAGKTVTHYTGSRHSQGALAKGTRGTAARNAADGSPEGRGKGTRNFEIILSSTLLFQTFADVKRPVEVTGIVCRNRLEAMQRIVEHELVHLLEMLVWDDSSCSQRRFHGIAQRFFGHREHRHDLITQAERAATKFQLKPGSRVRFRFEGQVLTGHINRITRRATVLVADPHGERFSDGHRYRRYYVPLEQLVPVK